MKTVLIVEDEKITAMDLKFKLEDLGYEVCGMAVNGADAIKLAYDTEPDLVLMDITLKGEMNGIKAAKSILNENIPLIFLTSHTDESTVKEANMVPSYGFLNKPFDMMKLERTIKLAINRSKIEIDKIHIAKGEESNLTDEDLKLREQAVCEFEAGKDFKEEFLAKKSNPDNTKYKILIVRRCLQWEDTEPSQGGKRRRTQNGLLYLRNMPERSLSRRKPEAIRITTYR